MCSAFFLFSPSLPLSLPFFFPLPFSLSSPFFSFLSPLSSSYTCSTLQMRDNLEMELVQTKDALSQGSLELRAMIRAFKEKAFEMSPSRTRSDSKPRPSNDHAPIPNVGDVSPMVPEPVRRIEVWLDDAQWSLMQDDGQLKVGVVCANGVYWPRLLILQIATIQLTNFSYNRVTFNDDSGEHRLELGSFRVKNCVPNMQSIFQVSGCGRRCGT